MHVWADAPGTPDNHDSWLQFLEQFWAKYVDTQEAKRACSRLKRFKLRAPRLTNILQISPPWPTMPNTTSKEIVPREPLLEDSLTSLRVSLAIQAAWQWSTTNVRALATGPEYWGPLDSDRLMHGLFINGRF